MSPLGADLVQINGKVITRARARALGLLTDDGAPKADAIVPSQRKGTKRPIVQKAKPKAKPAPIEPLRPRNVDHDGTPITDEATLAAIAAKALEADDFDPAAEAAAEEV